MLWMVLYTHPMLTVVQEMCARIGLVTGDGLGAVIKNRYSKKILLPLAGLLVIANTINIGADLGAMTASMRLIVPQVPFAIITVLFTAFILGSEVLIPYKKYVKVLKYLTLALFAYAITAIMVGGNWKSLLLASFIPKFEFTPDFAMMFVAMLGTTITPYLFFWQASEEAEDEVAEGKIKEISSSEIPRLKKREVRAMKADNAIGMAFSQLFMWFIISTAAGTLYPHGITNIQSADQAASALQPLVQTFPYSGEVAKLIFAVGIIGTGLLAVPVLAGSSAYAMADGFGWKQGLHKKFGQARAFYLVIMVSTLIGLWINFSDINPIRALIYSSVINGVVAVPMIFAILKIANDKKVLGSRTNGPITNLVGCITLIAMGAASAIMFLMWNHL
jgi:Mn2+/Fe2+ NRAMP family transporter